jgi:hypothetical protein
MTMALAQPLIAMRTRNHPGDKARTAHEAQIHTAICEPIVYKIWDPRRLINIKASTACYRDS